MTLQRKRLGLFKERHNMPVTEFIFESPLKNIYDFEYMRAMFDYKLKDITVLDLYVTGLTSALTEALNYCRLNRIIVNLYHFDINTNKYICQKIY